MNAKEKAKALITEFNELVCPYPKECARICVDEILKECRSFCDDNFHTDRMTYWLNVKKEIELL